MLARSTVATNKFFSAILAAVLLLTTLAACGQQTSNGTSQNTKPIVIGASIPNSGDFSADGLPTKQGYQLWANEINKRGGLLGHPVQLDLVSDNSTAPGTSVAYQKLINHDHVDLLMGPFADDEAVAAAKIANRSGYPMIVGSGTAPKVFTQGLTNLFSVSVPAKNLMNSFAEYILSLPTAQRPKTAAYLAQDDPYFHPQVEEAETLLEAGGVQTVLKLDTEGTYPAETTDYTPYVQKAIAAKADIVLMGTGTPDCIAFVKGFKQQHYNPKAMIFASGPDQGNQFTQPIGGSKVAEALFVPNGGWFAGLADTASYQNSQFKKDYIATYGGTADDISSDTVQAYSVGQVLEQAIDKAGSIDNGKIMQVLRSNTFNSLQGAVKFKPDGENEVAVAFLFQWQKGQLIPVYPQNNAVANPVYPRPVWP
ncbi:MAG: amino acid ABC transporter substrate-binding protein [Ktedonobacteraceae bacterium]|nr:amino acid ABC transporter substrate-binding protein [Ktedonobacteraceae bacterium]